MTSMFISSHNSTPLFAMSPGAFILMRLFYNYGTVGVEKNKKRQNMCTLVSYWRNRLLLLHQMSLLSVAETEALGTSNMDNGKIGNKSLQF